MKTPALIAVAALFFGALSSPPVAPVAQAACTLPYPATPAAGQATDPNAVWSNFNALAACIPPEGSIPPANGAPGAPAPALAWIPKSPSAVVIGIGDSTMLGVHATSCASLSAPVHFAAGSSSWGTCPLDRIGYATGATIVNLGIGGACFFACGNGSIYFNYQTKLAPYVGSHYNGNQYFIVQGGINDADNANSLDIDLAYQDMHNVVAWLKSQGVPYNRIEISGVLPANPNGAAGVFQKRPVVAALNSTWGRVALDPLWAGQVVVGDNYHPILNCMSTCIFSDGVHLNDTGYNVQANAWMAANARNAFVLMGINFPEQHVGGDATGLQAGTINKDTASAFCVYSSVAGNPCLFTSTTSGSLNGITPSALGLTSRGSTYFALDGQSSILATRTIRSGSAPGTDAPCAYSFGSAATSGALTCIGSNSSGGAVAGVTPSGLFVKVASTDLVAVDAHSGDLGVEGSLKARTATLSGLTPSRFVATDANKNLTSAGTAYFNGSAVQSLHFESGTATITLSSRCAALSACGSVTVNFGSAYTSTSTYSCNVSLDASGQNAATLSSLAAPVVARTSAGQATFTVHATLAVSPGTTSQVADWRCHGS